MDNDRLKYFNKNKELKALKEKIKILGEEIVELDKQIYPVERRFNRERVDWEFRIDEIKLE